jgi:hypothetical protein
MTKPENYQPPYTITPVIVNLVAEIGETIGRYTVLAEQNMDTTLAPGKPYSHYPGFTGN